MSSNSYSYQYNYNDNNVLSLYNHNYQQVPQQLHRSVVVQEELNYYQQKQLYFDNCNINYTITNPTSAANAANVIYPNEHQQCQLPIIQFDDTTNNDNVLQDDNFSIATASDLYNSTTPSLLSTTAQLTPYSTPSPQMISPELNYNNFQCGGDAASYYDGSFYSSYDLFAPVPDFSSAADMTIKQAKKRRSTTISSTSTASSAEIIEKRHICSICNHR